MKPFLVASLLGLVGVALPAIADSITGSFELQDTAWEEVPGTEPDPATILETEGQFSYPAYVDLNSLSWEGAIVTYDMVDTEGGYARVEANCDTQMFRSIRQGDFASATEVHYVNQVDEWQPFSHPSLGSTVSQFVCEQ